MKKIFNKKNMKHLLIFLAFEIVFCSLLCILLIFHGPFRNIKELYVTSAMSTLKHKYLAQWFVTQSEIDEILEKTKQGIKEDLQLTNQVAVAGSWVDQDVEYLEINKNKFKGYMLIESNPKRVSVGISENIGKSGEPLSKIVDRNNALGGINAGGFVDTPEWSGTGKTPTGLIIQDGKVVFRDTSKSYYITGFNDKDVLVVGKYTYEQIIDAKLRDAVSFDCPPLIVNGKPMIVSGDGGWGVAPRTAIAQTKDGKVIFLVIDGRQIESIGATLRDIQDLLLEQGAYNAANLDGGSSSTMYFENKITNKPADILGERAIPSAFIIKR